MTNDIFTERVADGPVVPAASREPTCQPSLESGAGSEEASHGQVPAISDGHVVPAASREPSLESSTGPLEVCQGQVPAITEDSLFLSSKCSDLPKASPCECTLKFGMSPLTTSNRVARKDPLFQRFKASYSSYKLCM